MNYAGCKVKMFCTEYYDVLEDRINKFLEECGNRDYIVYVIKYQYAKGKYGGTYTAMIIYSTQ